MKTKAEAEELAAAMTSVGDRMGVQMSHLLSPMDEPLGRAVGNALEVAECVEILQGGGPSDLINLILDLAVKVSTSPRAELAARLTDGRAWKKFIALVSAQDGDATTLEKVAELHTAPVIKPFKVRKGGAVQQMDAESIGRASVLLGGGRRKASDTIDFAVGFSAIKKIGEKVERNEPLMMVHARDEASMEAILPLLEKATAIR